MTTVLSRDGTRLLTGIESARQRLQDALRIRRGSYPFARDYGSTFARLVDDAVDADFEAAVYAAVADAMTWPPNGLADVTLRRISISLDDADRIIAVDIEADWIDPAGRRTPMALRQFLAEISDEHDHPHWILLGSDRFLLMGDGRPLKYDAAHPA